MTFVSEETARRIADSLERLEGELARLAGSRSPASKPACAALLVCLRCDGLGEWDELQPARSRVQESPDYKQIECPDCGGTGRLKAGRT